MLAKRKSGGLETRVALGPTLIERYEMKYHILPEQVPAIRDYIRQVCVPDKASQNGAYTLSSLYLDSPNQRLYRETRERSPRRFKLRIRRYLSGPYFLEVKRRALDTVKKSRCPIPAAAWPRAFVDPGEGHALKLPPDHRIAYDQFVNESLRIAAQPSVIVRYDREAWVSTIDDYARVTFDKNILGAAPDGWAITIDDNTCWYRSDASRRFGVAGSGVILELKCTTHVPTWMTDLVNYFSLKRSGFSKYATSVEVIQPEQNYVGKSNWTDLVGGF